MTNEKAIKTLERSNVMLKEQISALRKGYSLLEETDNSAYQTIEYCEPEYAAVELALSALREQAEIVKCKNCIYQKDAKVNCKGFVICPVSNMEITDDDYCSYGERRESEVSE